MDIPVFADDSVAGHEDKEGIIVVRLTDGADSFGAADKLSNILIASRLAVGNGAEGVPDALSERCSPVEDRKLERFSLSGEILCELFLRPLGKLCFRSGIGERRAGLTASGRLGGFQ